MKSLLNFLYKKPKISQKCETIEGIDFKFRKNPLSKCVRISLKDKSSVLVTMPRRVSFNFAREFALKNLDGIKGALRNFEQADEKYIEEMRKRAKNYLPQRLKELADMYGYKYGKVTVKRMKTRWGSCSFKNNINLNLSLMTLEDELIDYVLLHELTHTVEKNHSQKFWARLIMYMPDAKLRQRKIKSRKVI